VTSHHVQEDSNCVSDRWQKIETGRKHLICNLKEDLRNCKAAIHKDTFS